jgi:hypothetical protein
MLSSGRNILINKDSKKIITNNAILKTSRVSGGAATAKLKFLLGE